jgi:serine/threonine protein kinase/DNA-directed RNA polymerase specialized sigma24 family protein
VYRHFTADGECGDEEARQFLELLWRAYAGYLRKVVFRSTHNTDEAEEIASIVFVTAAEWIRQHRRKPRPIENLRAWLCTMAEHIVGERQRRQRASNWSDVDWFEADCTPDRNARIHRKPRTDLDALEDRTAPAADDYLQAQEALRAAILRLKREERRILYQCATAPAVEPREAAGALRRFLGFFWRYAADGPPSTRPAQGVVHRDLKPANMIMLSSPEVKTRVIDLGMAKAMEPPADEFRSVYQEDRFAELPVEERNRYREVPDWLSVTTAMFEEPPVPRERYSEGRLGSRYGNYELLRPVGSGAFGCVWLAKPDRNREPVAVKLLRQPRSLELQGLERYRNCAVNNRHLMPVLEMGVCDDRPYYIMPLADDFETGRAPAVPELYQATTLERHLLARGKLPLDESLEIADEVASALETLHDHGLCHRDVKPSNIFRVQGHWCLGDFGLVARAGVKWPRGGTPGFAPPELWDRPANRVGSQAEDIYSLGKTLYLMVTGQNLSRFDGFVLNRWKPDDWNDEDWLSRGRRLRRLVSRACHPDPEKRIPDAREFRQELAHIADCRTALPEPAAGHDTLTGMACETVLTQPEKKAGDTVLIDVRDDLRGQVDDCAPYNACPSPPELAQYVFWPEPHPADPRDLTPQRREAIRQHLASGCCACNEAAVQAEQSRLHDVGEPVSDDDMQWLAAAMPLVRRGIVDFVLSLPDTQQRAACRLWFGRDLTMADWERLLDDEPWQIDQLQANVPATTETAAALGLTLVELCELSDRIRQGVFNQLQTVARRVARARLVLQ